MLSGLLEAVHIGGMKAAPWTLAPARLCPMSLDPRPVKNPNSPGFPTSAPVARACAAYIKAARPSVYRGERSPRRRPSHGSRRSAWRTAWMGFLAEIREDEDIGNQKNETADPLPERPLPPSST